MRVEAIPTAWTSEEIQRTALVIPEPFSFWGGIDPHTGRITDPRVAGYGEAVADRILILHRLRGSSSSSSILLELIYQNKAPGALILPAVDAILVIGCLVATEMGWPAPAIGVCPPDQHITVHTGDTVRLAVDGQLSVIAS